MPKRRHFFSYFAEVDRDDSGLLERNEVECKSYKPNEFYKIFPTGFENTLLTLLRYQALPGPNCLAIRMLYM